ncbi:MAG: hypothetical protein H7Y03_05165 [Chitinophagaceae bacterium]|nr:hypothetical protein [Chitinophagaceae bacterium]
MKKYIRYIVLHACFIFITLLSYSQQGVSVSASVNKNAIIIGEPIELRLEATIPAGMPYLWFSVDTLPHFELIDKGKVDSTVAGVYRQTIILTSFDSGRNMIPPVSLELNGRSYLTDSIAVMVSFSEFDPKKEYHDIKDILEVEAVKDGYLKWLLLGVGTLLLLLLIWYLFRKFRKKKSVDAVTVSPLSAFEEALKGLEELKKQQLTEKQFYTRMNDILRWFVYRKNGITTMQKTNEEFILQLDKLNMPREDFTALAQTLRMADAVKFAKYVPAEEENDNSYRVIRKSIEQLNNINNSAV